MSANLLIPALLGATIIFLYAYADWQRAIKAVLVIVVFEGALRKWVLPQASELIYFFKDLVLLGAYASYYKAHIMYQKKYAHKTIFDLLVFVIAIWCAVEIFNPRLGSPIVGLLGFKAYVYYIPLVWILPKLFSTQEQFYSFLRTYLLLIIPIGVLGIVQYFSPVTSPINRYVPGEVTGIATVGSNARITGTFSYLAGYGVYLMICFGLLLPLVSVPQSWRWRLLLGIALFLVVVNSFMSGSRGVVFTQALLLILYLLFLGIRQPRATMHLLRQFALPALLVAYLVSTQFTVAIDNFMTRVNGNQDLSGRIIDNFADPFRYTEYSGWIGYGIGATLPGGNAMRAMLRLPAGEWIPVYYESEMARVVLEIGPIGFVLWYLLRIILVLLLFGLFWRLRTPVLRQLALMAFLIHLIQLNGQLVVNPTFNVYYWVLASFIFLLPQLDEAYETPVQKEAVHTHVPTARYPRPSYG